MQILLLSTLILLTLVPAARALVWPGASWETAEPEDFGIDRDRLDAARDYALNGQGSGFLIHRGYRIYHWGDPDAVYELKSTTKSIGVTALGLAIKDGLLDLDDVADPLHPSFALPPSENVHTGWIPQVTLTQLATHSAGFAKDAGYTEFQYQPGTAWDYSDGGPNWLAEIVTLAFGADLLTVMRDRILTPLGVAPDEFTWRANWHRPEFIQGIERREFGSGMGASVDTMARIGLLYLRGGRWQEQQLLPIDFIDLAKNPHPMLAGLDPTQPDIHRDAPRRYGLLWWNNATAMMPGVPRDAFFSWGQYESLIVVVPSLDLVIARAGPAGFGTDTFSDYAVLEPFITPICEAIALPEPAPGVAWPASALALGWLARRRRSRRDNSS